MTNHLWQSTVFAAAGWGLALVLRKNRAAVRHAIWLAASIKFLIPFSILVAIGSRIEWRSAPPPSASQLTAVISQIAQPFPKPEMMVRAAERIDSSLLPAILFVIWLCGAVVCAILWGRQWLRARAVVRSASLRGAIGPIRVFASPERIEPGIFGIFRPALLLPEGIETRLAPEQIRAIIAHEMAHVRRHDNLWFAIHMLVESIFWFHPAVWLIRAKLAEERERACDEAVLCDSVEPEVYAEGILNVCRYYLEPRLACVSGVSGSDLRKRIEAIMTGRVIGKMSVMKRAVLAAAAVGVVVAPIAIGLMEISSLRAQEKLSFDVASVKPNTSGEGINGWRFEEGRLVAFNMPLYALIGLAYDLPMPQFHGGMEGGAGTGVSGGPDWVRTAVFDVEGKASLAAGLSRRDRESRMKLMLRSLLEDRFQLKLRRESREIPVYALVVAKNGTRLKRATIEEKDCPEGRVENACHVISGGRPQGMHARAVDLNDVAQFVGHFTGRPLINRTGLQGLYQLETEGWTTEEIAAADPARQNVQMMFEKLGLKMEAQKGAAEVYTIDHVERPSAN